MKFHTHTSGSEVSSIQILLGRPEFLSRPRFSSAPGICSILCHFIPFYSFHLIQMFHYQLVVVFKEEKKKKEIEKKQNSISLKTGKRSGLNFLSDSGQVSWQLVIWTHFRFQSKFHRALLPPSGPR